MDRFCRTFANLPHRTARRVRYRLAFCGARKCARQLRLREERRRRGERSSRRNDLEGNSGKRAQWNPLFLANRLAVV